MKRGALVIVMLIFAAGLFTAMSDRMQAQSSNTAQEYYELRTYSFKSADDCRIVDQYLSQAELPALKRRGIGPVGVFTELEPPEGQSHIYVLVPYQSLDHYAKVRAELFEDAAYLKAADTYLKTEKNSPAYERIETSLMVAFAGMPRVKAPAAATTNGPRIFEMRIYESHNERMGHLKVEMFNKAEIDIFLDCGINPVFFGQTLAGGKMPNLTYMATYDDMDARQAAWQKFRTHPQWQVLKNVERYKDTVSNITQMFLKPKPYSQI